MPAPISALGPSVLIPVYVAIILIGYVIFHTSGLATATGNELSRQRALFASVNAATLTGFAQSTNVNDYTPLGQATACGLVIAGILFSLITGGTAVCRIAGLPYSDKKIALGACLSVVIVAVLGAITLSGNDSGAAGGAFDALCAFGNCGLFLGALPGRTSLAAQAALLPLAVLGGLGLPVLMNVVDRLVRRRPPSVHVRAVLTWTAVVYVTGVVLLLAVDSPSLHAPATAWRRTIISASTLSLNSRSAGFPFSFATDWPRDVQWVVMLLMLFGGASGGTAGGIKVNTVGLLLDHAADPYRGKSPLGVAVRWLLVYGACLGASLLALLASEPQIPGDRVLFLAISALANVGLSHDPVVLSDTGWWLTAAVMLIGRLAPILMLWWMADTAREASVAVG